MGDTDPAESPPLAWHPQWWRIGRASLGFILDNFAISRGAGDVLDPLILSVIVEANTAPINQDLALSHRYAALDAPPPDALRRPVSVNAVAASLRMPYETVRRRIARLTAAGVCVAGPRGVVVPAATIGNPLYAAQAMARYDRLKAFYQDLVALDAFAGAPLPASETPPYAAPPVRAANRAVSEYLLRVIDAIMRRLGDPLTGLVLLEMAQANAEHLPAGAGRIEGPMPDAQRRPVSALELSRRLGLPPETVRRHVRRLEAEAFCRRITGGRLAALEQLGRGADGAHGLADNLQNVQRLFARCAALGIVAYWQGEG